MHVKRMTIRWKRKIEDKEEKSEDRTRMIIRCSVE